MNKLNIITAALLLFCTHFVSFASSPTDSLQIKYKTKIIHINPDDGPTSVIFKDTGKGESIYVTVDNEKNAAITDKTRKVINVLDPLSTDDWKTIKTSFIRTLDIGFTSVQNNNPQASFVVPRTFKSANINLNIASLTFNLYQKKLLLTAGFNLNNYYLKYSDRQMIQYVNTQGVLTTFNDSVSTYSKNRQDIRYYSFPVLLEYHSEDKDFQIAAGIEYSVDGRTHLKQKGSDENGSFKRKSDNDIAINPNQLNAIFKLGFDDIALFARYSLTPMFKSDMLPANQGKDQNILSFGVCLLGI